ncbi:MAG: serine/threonine-protein kinase [Polyangiaceae bacterium]
MQSAPAANRLIAGRYELLGQLGAGGTSTVYDAIDRSPARPSPGADGQRVAVKLLDESMLQRPNVVARFEREASAARALDSEHIAKVLDHGRDEHQPYLVLEYLEGRDLSRVLGEVGGRLPPPTAIKIAIQTCRALIIAHAAGVVHRDIKPANIFLTANPDSERITVKVLDFGIAKTFGLAEEGDISLTRTGSVLGSPRYMSPEQSRGKKSIDVRTDVWSVGIVLFQCLSGMTPHENVEILADLILAISTAEAPPLSAVVPGIDPRLSDIVSGALKIDVAQRTPNIAEVLTALEALGIDDLLFASDLRPAVGPAPSLPPPRSLEPSPELSGLSQILDGLPSAPPVPAIPPPPPAASDEPPRSVRIATPPLPAIDEAPTVTTKRKAPIESSEPPARSTIAPVGQQPNKGLPVGVIIGVITALVLAVVIWVLARG